MKQQDHPPGNNSGISLGEAAAYGASGLAGILSTLSTIKGKFFTNLRILKLTQPYVQERDEAYTRIYTEHSGSGQSAAELGKKLSVEEEKYYNKLCDYAESIGVRVRSPLVGKLDMWKTLHHAQKAEIAFTTAAVAGVTLGAIFAFMSRYQKPETAQQQQLFQQVTQGVGQNRAG